MIRHGTVAPGAWFPVHEIHSGRAAGYARLMRMGRTFPPVVVVECGDSFMPLDGHHRLTAAAENGTDMPAWIIDGDWFETACERRRTAGRADPDGTLVALCDRLTRQEGSNASQGRSNPT